MEDALVGKNREKSGGERSRTEAAAEHANGTVLRDSASGS